MCTVASWTSESLLAHLEAAGPDRGLAASLYAVAGSASVTTTRRTLLTVILHLRRQS
jgi:hypothetical protein